MEKPAETSLPLAEILRRRWSPRAFRPEAVPRDVLASLFEAARWAPSAYNEQPWRFLAAVRNTPDFARMLSCLHEANREWAQASGALVAACAVRNFNHNGRVNRWYHHDLGLAVENFMLQGVHEGLFVHPMAGFSPARVREHFGVPEEMDPLVMLALGFPGEAEDLPSEELRQRERAPRERLPREALVFGGAWGAPFFVSE